MGGGWDATTVFEAELRDTAIFASEDGDQTGFNVLQDTHHLSDFSDFQQHALYVWDTHDSDFPITIASTNARDTAFTEDVAEATFNTSLSDKSAKYTFNTIGRLHFVYDGGSLTSAPSNGSTKFVLHSVGRER